MSAGATFTRAKLRPSVLPMVDRKRGGCVQFLSEGDSPVLEEGRDRHKAWELLFYGDRSLFDLLSPENQEGVQWACDYLWRAKGSACKVTFEKHLTLVDESFEAVFPDGGHADAVAGPNIFDLKWRPRDYTGQMAAYALMWMQESGFCLVNVHCLYGATQRHEVRTWTEPEAREEVNRILREYHDPGIPAEACDYCGWCSRKLQCAAFNAPAIKVAQGREDWSMQTYHVTQITTPEDMAKAIQLASLLRKWCDAVDFHKRRWAINQGIKIPGYTIREELGDREITDINEALRLIGLPLERFLRALSCGLGKLKKEVAEHRGISLAAADREINKVLAPIIRREPKQTVVREKEV